MHWQSPSIIMGMGFFCSLIWLLEHGRQWWTKWWLVSAELAPLFQNWFRDVFSGTFYSKARLIFHGLQSLSTLEIEFETKSTQFVNVSEKPTPLCGSFDGWGCIFWDDSSGVRDSAGVPLQTSTKGSKCWRRLRVRSRYLWRGDTQIAQIVAGNIQLSSVRVIGVEMLSSFRFFVMCCSCSPFLARTSWQKVAVLPAAINLEEEIGTEPLIDCDNPKTMNHTGSLQAGQYLIYLPVVSEVGL